MLDTLYNEPLIYRMLFDRRGNDIDFYLERALEAGGPVLELGVGVGRIALPMAARGVEVVGVDRSPAMLDELAQRVADDARPLAELMSWRLGDARALDLGRRFPLVTMPFNGMAHFHDADDLDRLFASVRRHLTPGGTFVFDVLVPDRGLTGAEEGTASSVPWFRDPRSGEVSRYDERARYDPVTKVLSIETELRSMEREAEPELLTLRLRLFERAELRSIIEARGFEISSVPAPLGDVVAWACRLARP